MGKELRRSRCKTQVTSLEKGALAQAQQGRQSVADPCPKAGGAEELLARLGIIACISLVAGHRDSPLIIIIGGRPWCNITSDLALVLFLHKPQDSPVLAIMEK